jgi:hypothetical protein
MVREEWDKFEKYSGTGLSPRMSKVGMNLQELLFHRFRTIGRLGRFLVATCFAAVLNFGQILSQTMRAASSAGTPVVDGYEITICYFGPPASFYPRLFICCSLLIATVGVFRSSFPRSMLAMFGLAGAVAVYFYWWITSYRVFRNFTDADIAFLNNPEIKRAGYLYQGTWLDIGVAASVVVCSVLLLDRLLNRRCIVS